MKILKCLFPILFFQTTLIFAQSSQVFHLVELAVETENANGHTVIFHLNKYDPNYVVWTPEGYITYDKRIVNPDDVKIEGNYSYPDKGWDANCTNFQNNPLPWMGRTKCYKLWVDKNSAFLKVDCYGTNFLGDVVVDYDYLHDVFKVNGNTVTEVKLYDDPSGLQPTPPRNFICTNASHVGQHPHFTWSAPSDRSALRFHTMFTGVLGPVTQR
jgi:hypothetical protein